MKNHYDYIICGAGAAGLSLASKFTNADLQQYKILIIDKDAKQKDDRTWCIWTEGNGPFDHLAEKRWSKILFRNNDFEKQMDIHPLQYIKIKGIDFYNYTLNKINAAPNVTFLQDEVKGMEIESEKSSIRTANSGVFTCDWVFNSILKVDIDKSKYNYVDQHFKGWVIETADNSFNDSVATFMDFTIDQKGECRFMYVLPTSNKSALVEVAIFSNNILSGEEYDSILQQYIEHDLAIDSYSIKETELGVIPMTTYPFEKANKVGLTYIGTAGSAAKASTGYAFLHIQDQVDHLIDKIKSNQKPGFEHGYYSNKYRWYDNVLLNVLLNNRASLGKVFGDMFKKLPTPLMLKFLANKTTLFEDLKILSKPKYLPFLKAAVNEFWKTK